MTSPHFIIGTSVWSILDADLRKHLTTILIVTIKTKQNSEEIIINQI